MDKNTVAFCGYGSTGYTGIFKIADQGLCTVADVHTASPLGHGLSSMFTRFADPSLSSETVAFAAMASGKAGVYAYLKNGLQRVIDQQTLIPDAQDTDDTFIRFSSPSLREKCVLFYGTSRGKTGIYQLANRRLTRLVDISAVFKKNKKPSDLSFFPNPPSYHQEKFVFLYEEEDAAPAIYLAESGQIQRLVGAQSMIPCGESEKSRFETFSHPSIDALRIVFRGEGNRESGIYSNIAGKRIK